MGFFDNLGKKASAAYDATAEKTGKIAKEAKLKMKMNENKSDINDIYKEIGRKVYEKHVREENIDIKTELEEECTKIDVLSAEIETCLKSILELKAKKQCEQCHAEIELDAAFCPKCGAKQPEAETEVEVKEAEVVGVETNAETKNVEAEVAEASETSKTSKAEENVENKDAEIIKEELENADIKPENQTEKEIVENDVSGNSEQESESEVENDLKRVTEVMAQETQEEAKEKMDEEEENLENQY